MYQDPTVNNVGRLRIRVKGRNGEVPKGDGTSKAWPSKGPKQCIDQDQSELVPLQASKIERVTDTRHLANFSNRFGMFNASGDLTGFDNPNAQGAFAVNGIAGHITPWLPLLDMFVNGLAVPKERFATAIFPDDTPGAHLVLNNLDALVHPYHLHNKAFTILKQGSGVLDATHWQEMVKAGELEPTGQEARRDTLVVPGSSRAV